MSVALVIDKPSSIALVEWRDLVAADAALRLRSEPYLAHNPGTGEVIRVNVGQADAEVNVGGQWEPFLRWSGGRLTTEYQVEFDDPTNPIRRKLVDVAKTLGAVLRTDAGDEALEW